jgi:hypothetical protein
MEQLFWGVALLRGDQWQLRKIGPVASYLMASVMRHPS